MSESNEVLRNPQDSRPGTIRRLVTVDLPRPRDLNSSGYLARRDEVFQSMGM